MMKIYEDDKGDIQALRSSKKFDTRAPAFFTHSYQSGHQIDAHVLVV